MHLTLIPLHTLADRIPSLLRHPLSSRLHFMTDDTGTVIALRFSSVGAAENPILLFIVFVILVVNDDIPVQARPGVEAGSRSAAVVNAILVGKAAGTIWNEEVSKVYYVNILLGLFLIFKYVFY